MEEDRLQQIIELGKGFPVLGPQGICRIQNGCDAFLFGEGWKENF
jgi:hypothetical protein